MIEQGKAQEGTRVDLVQLADRHGGPACATKPDISTVDAPSRPC